MHSSVRSNLIDIRLIPATKPHSQCALIEYVQPQESMIIETSKKVLSLFLLGDTPDAPYSRSNLPKRQGPKFYLHSLDTAEVGFKLENVHIFYSIPIADDLHMSP